MACCRELLSLVLDFCPNVGYGPGSLNGFQLPRISLSLSAVGIGFVLPLPAAGEKCGFTGL